MTIKNKNVVTMDIDSKKELRFLPEGASVRELDGSLRTNGDSI
jgi:hypothetical protein